MQETKVLHEQYKSKVSEIDAMIHNFKTSGIPFGNQERNSLKLFELEGKAFNVKSFRIPNIINQVAYKFFRKSKAQRSFEYANKLKELGVGTPQPIAYYEYKTLFLFQRSYYISEQLECDLTYRELTRDLNFPDHETILRAFTRFTFKLHQNNINFLDHSPGNTLIKKVDNEYRFYLVDLNRMEFKTMGFDTRIHNFARLTIHKSIVKTMSDEYAKCSGEDYQKVYSKMWQLTQDFQERFHKKRRLKKKLKFWKKNN